MEPNELAAAAGRYRDMIYRVALHWCGHPQEAEDATQDTLLKLCTTHRHFADEEHLRSWLLRVTINHCKKPPARAVAHPPPAAGGSARCPCL